MNVIDQLRNISEELKLSFETFDAQDWGIINSSADRVDEFINFFNEKSLLNEMKYQVFELICASYNDALVEGKCNQEIQIKFMELFHKNINNPAILTVFNYWKSLDGEEFPIGDFLRELE